MSFATLWDGPYQAEGLAAFRRAKEAGLSTLRAMALGHIGSYKDCWVFRNKLARLIGASLRTVGRALADGRAEGLIGTARGGKHEVPPGASSPITCGFSHRWTIGWGKAGKVVQDAVAAAKAVFEQRRLTRLSLAAVMESPAPRRPLPPRAARGDLTRRRWSAAEIDAELAKTRPPDKPDP